VVKPIQDVDLDRAIESLFEVDDGRPCPRGNELLRNFALNRPQDFEFLRPSDLVDLSTCSFAGISEWDAFAQHFGTCELCNA
jgi:hypothetical protein